MSFEGIVDEIKNKSRLSSIVSKYVKLKSNGGGKWIGLCPFHGEKTPSFHVNDDSCLFYCFGCQERGDMFNFLQKIKNLTFWDVLTDLANDYQIIIPKNFTDKEKLSTNEIFYEINHKAMIFFQNNLSENKKALDYLILKRKLEQKTIDNFCFGYADSIPNKNLLKHLLSLGYNEKILLDLGLIRQYQTSYLDFFYDRLMIPIFDKEKRVIAFSGRTIINSDGPKYINSPESSVFKKSKVLYNIQNTNRVKNNNLIVVEGYMDAISLYQSGYENVVAPMGTSLTADHLNMIYKLSQNVIFCLDSDSAGRKAMYKVAEMIYKEENFNHISNSANFIVLDGYKDIDELLSSVESKNKKERIDSVIKNSISVNKYIVECLLIGRKLNDPKDEAYIRDSFFRIISQSKNQNIIKSYTSWLNNYIFEKKKPSKSTGISEIKNNLIYNSYQNILLCKMLCFGIEDDRVLNLIDSKCNDDIYFDFIEYYHNCNNDDKSKLEIVEQFLEEYSDKNISNSLLGNLKLNKFYFFINKIEIIDNKVLGKISTIIIPDLINLAEEEILRVINSGSDTGSILAIRKEIDELKGRLYKFQTE